MKPVLAAVAAGSLCAACRHPVRRHNAEGCLVEACWCNGDSPALPAAPLPPPSAKTLDRLDPQCARCPHRRGRHVTNGSAAKCQRCSCSMFIHNTGDDDAAAPPPVDVPELAPDAGGPPVDGEEASAEPTAGRNAGPGGRVADQVVTAVSPAAVTTALDQFRACPIGCGWTQKRTEFAYAPPAGSTS